MKGSVLEKVDWRKDPLLLSVVGAAALLALLNLTMFYYQGSGPVIAEIPWFVPLVNTFLLVAALSVAFLALSRFHVLRCPLSYWLGVASLVLGIGLVFYVLTWPGLTPGGRAIIGRLPGTSAWMATVAQTFLALFLLTAVVARIPCEWLNGKRWVWSVAGWILFAASIHILLLAFENRLPALVRTDGSYAPTFFVLHWIAFILFAAGIVISTRRYLLSRDALAAYIALGQAACAAAILMLIIGSKRYNLWWYLARILTASSFPVIMYGLLSEYVGLFRREREKSRKLRESEERFRTLVESSADVLYRMSPDWSEMRHLRSRDFLANTDKPSRTWLQEYIHPDDWSHVIAVINEAIRTKSIFELEHRVLRADGILGWTFSRAIPRLDASGEIVEWFGAASDITERKRAEEALRASEERFRAFMDNSPTIAWAKDEQGRLVYLSRTYEKRLGLRLDDCLGKTDYEIYPPEIADVLRKNDQAVLATGHTMTVTEEKVDPDGSRRTWWNFKFPFQDASGRRYVGGVGVDITEQKRAEEDRERLLEEIHVQHARLEAILDSLPVGVWITDASGKMVEINDVARDIWGGRTPYAQGIDGYEDYKAWWADTGERIAAEDMPLARAVRGEKIKDRIVDFERFDGTRGAQLVSAAPIQENGKTVGSVAIVQDITGLKQAEEALRQSERSLRGAIEIAELGTWEYDAPNSVTRFDERCRVIFGFTEDRLVPDEEVFNLIHPDDRARVREEVRVSLDPQGSGLYKTEYRILRPDGIVKWVMVRGHALWGTEGTLHKPVWFRGTVMDLTELKRAEEGLRRAHEEMEQRVQERTADLQRKNQELQEFAFIASHDLNEPLRKVQVFGSLLETKSADRLFQEEKDYISRMTDAASRMQELLAALLNYSRIETKGEVFRPTPLDDVVRDTISDMEVGISNVKAEVRVGPLPIVRGDSNQLRQLFQNLIGNAIKYRRPDVTTVIKIAGEEQDGACRVFVEDNGIGFEEKYLDKIFQPFQRLHGRNEYQGIGIGLAICRKIVERHRGTITATSTPGKGSTFIVTLPMDGTKATKKSE